MHICDSGCLCRYYDMYLMYSVAFIADELLQSDICHLLISRVGVNIATDILCDSDDCHCKLPVIS